MKAQRFLVPALFSLCVVGGLAACSDKDEKNTDGPVEKTLSNAGEAIDQSMDKAAEAIDDAATDVGNAVEDTCEDVKKKAGAEDTDC